MIRYKLTDQNIQTYNKFQWKLGEEQSSPGTGELCSKGWFHCYTDPLLAVFLNPIHADFDQPRLFKVQVDGDCKTDFGLKEGWTRMKLLEEISLPEVSLEQRIAFAILCAREVYDVPTWNKWAEDWLSGEDRSYESAEIIWRNVALVAALAAPESPLVLATRAARDASAAAARRIAAALATGAAFAAAATAAAAARAPCAARETAEVTTTKSYLDLINIVNKAMEY